jgi:cell shape-determining protein MreC
MLAIKSLLSGLSDLYAEGLTIGSIVKIDDQGTGMHQTADVAPTVQFSSLYEVMILYNIQATELPVPSSQEEVTP